ncbi:MAG: TldD/PmbA family protein [Acidobacteriota bacterium]
MKEKNNLNDSLRQLVERLVTFASAHGADEVEVKLSEGIEFNVDVRLQEIENLLEARPKTISFKIIKDKKTAWASSSDFKKDNLYSLIKNAIKRAELTQPDKFAGLPEYDSLNYPDPEKLEIYDPEIKELNSREKIQLALKTEKTALADTQITNSHGASFFSREEYNILGNSKGFLGSYRESLFSLGIGLQAGETNQRAEDGWHSNSRFFRNLDSPEKVAQKAVARTIRHLNPQKISTRIVPVILEPLMTSWLLGFLFHCLSGPVLYRQESFLVNRLEDQIGGNNITVIDHGLMPGKLGTRPFDEEGNPTRKTMVIDKGILKNYLCDTYSAKKLGLNSTGNAARSGVASNNFYLEPGNQSPEEIISELEEGLLLTRVIGHGLNPVTGEISRGAFGLWIEKGKILHPVAEITISGNLEEILKKIIRVGSDLDFRRQICGPTIMVEEMILAGN